MMAPAPVDAWSVLKNEHVSVPQAALAVCCIAVLALALCGPAQGPLRRLLQPICARVARRQLTWIRAAQRLHTPLLDKLVMASAVTVTVEFYIALLPYLVWVGNVALGYKVIFGLALTTYVTFVLKDLICSPRPEFMTDLEAATAAADAAADAAAEAAAGEAPRLKIIKEKQRDVEPGVPSAHVALSLALNFYLLHVLGEGGHLPAAARLPLAVASCAWLLWIAFGRIYFAVHTPIDLLSGLAVGCSVLSLWMALDDVYVHWLITGYNVPLYQLAASFAALYYYPAPDTYTTCYMYAVTFMGAAAGGALSLARHAACPAANAPLLALPTAKLLLKLAAGYVVVIFTKVVSKTCLLAVVAPALDLAPARLRALWQPPVYPSAVRAFRRSSSSGGGGRNSGAGALMEADASPRKSCGVLLKPDGVPWDVDTTARFISYALTVVAVGEYNCLWSSFVR